MNNTEIERKFLVCGEFKAEAYEAVHIVQGYISSSRNASVRVRLRGERGFITVKSSRSASMMSRFEWEHEIPAEDARLLLSTVGDHVIDKTRYLIKSSDGVHTWEVDEFHADNEGLVVAEVELSSEDEPFAKPQWLGQEVTTDPRYFNSQLVANPYCNWPDAHGSK